MRLKKRNFFNKKFLLVLLVILIPIYASAQIRLATSTLMNKSQMANGGSINPLTKGEGRISFDYHMGSGSYDMKKSSDYYYSDGSNKGSTMSIGFDGKTESGHYSIGYYNSKTELEYTYNNLSNSNYDLVYKYNDIYTTTYLLGGFTTELNTDTSLGFILNMVSKKGEVKSNDTINRGYVWTSTGTTNKSRSGDASADYNQIRIFGKNKLNQNLNLGFTIIPEASKKTKYSDDFSTTNFRRGNGLILGGAFGSESSGRNYEAGIMLEQENKNSGDGSERIIFFLYEFVSDDKIFLTNFINSESEKLKDGSTNISRPSSSNEIIFQTQLVFDSDMSINVSVDYYTFENGEYGTSSSDLTYFKSGSSMTFGISVNSVF